jgi:hypothetical protein
MTPKEKAKELVDEMYNTDYCGIKHFPNERYCDCTEINHYQAKQCASIAVDEIIEYHNSLFDKGFKDVHIAISSPIKTYIDILNPLLEYWEEVKQEIEKL